VNRLELEKEALVQERYTVFDEAMVRFNQHLGRIYRYEHGIDSNCLNICTLRLRMSQVSREVQWHRWQVLLYLMGCHERMFRQLTAEQGDAYVSYCNDPTLCFLSGATLRIRLVGQRGVELSGSSMKAHGLYAHVGRVECGVGAYRLCGWNTC
jgi:hypothetical protein